jgi:hypothetical protein
MKQFFNIIIISVLTALGFSSCVGCNPGLVYGPLPPPEGYDDTNSVQVEKPVNVEDTTETTAP